MKKCPKCNKTFDDSSIFCTSCGSALEQELVCEKCGVKINPSDKFCPRCGTAILHNDKTEETSNLQPQIDSSNVTPVADSSNTNVHESSASTVAGTEQTKFNFSSGRNQYRTPCPTITEITAEKNILTITQYKIYMFFKYGRHTNQLDISTITNIVTKKKLSLLNLFWCVFLVIVLISCLSAGSYFWALVCLVVLVSIAKYCLHNQILYIYFANGYAKIPEETSEDNDVEPLVSYIRQYNPNITKIEIAN